MSYFTSSELNELSTLAKARQTQLIEDAIPHVLNYIRSLSNKDDVTTALKKACSEHKDPKELKVRLCTFPWSINLGLRGRIEPIRRIVNTPQFRARLANLLGLGYFVVHTVYRQQNTAVLTASFFPKGDKGLRQSQCLFKNTGSKLKDHVITANVCACCGAYNTEKAFKQQHENERIRRVVEIPDAVNISFSPISQEGEECPGCGEDIDVGANGYCATCWQERFGTEDDTLEQCYFCKDIITNNVHNLEGRFCCDHCYKPHYINNPEDE